jgi:predicted enzyme related to lactoylglutathione lyase
MADNPVQWFEIYVADMERAKSFYEAVFGLELQRLPASGDELEMWAFPGGPASAGATGALVRMLGVQPGVGGTVVYFGCQDCARTAARVSSSGGRIDRPKLPVGQHGYIALVRDTEGNLIGLHSFA